MQNFLNACVFHLARGIVDFAVGGFIFVAAPLYITYKNNPH